MCAGLGAGAVAGIVIGCVILVVGIVALVAYRSRSMHATRTNRGTDTDL